MYTIYTSLSFMGFSESGARHKNIVPKNPQSNLESKVIKGLLSKERNFSHSRFSVAKKKGYFKGIDNEHQLRRKISKVFGDYYALEQKGVFFEEVWSDEARTVYQEAVLLLILSDVAKLITAGDWQVDRTTAAENNLGLQKGGHFILQKLIAENIGEPGVKLTQLHKGQGNGASMIYLIKKQQQEIKEGKTNQNTWIEKGISDKLYFPLEDIIFEVVNSSLKSNETIKKFLLDILCPIIKRKLKAKWFASKGSTINEWTQVVPFCDVNDIYEVIEEIIRNQEVEILSQLEPPLYDKIKTSKDYTDDSLSNIPTNLLRLLLSLRGKDVGEYQSKERNDRKSTIIRDKKQVLKERDFLLGLVPCKIQKINAIREKYGLFERANSEDILSVINEKLDEFDSQLQYLMNENSQLNGTGSDVSCSRITSIGEMFSEKLFLSDSKKRPNLNKLAYLYFGGVKLGWFTDIPELFPGEEFALIFSSKGDSHEGDEVYEQDIKNNLKALKKGGVYITDGMKSSFSRIYRLDIVKKVVDELNEEYVKNGLPLEYKVLCALDKKRSYGLLSCILMRRSSEGLFLFDPTDYDVSESAIGSEEVFQDRVILKTVEKTLKLPFVDVITYVRRKVFHLTTGEKRKGDVDIFKGKHKDIIKIIKHTLNNFAKINFLKEWGIGESLLSGGEIDKDMVDISRGDMIGIERLVQEGSIHFSFQEINAIYQEVENKIRILFMGNPSIQGLISPAGLTRLRPSQMTLFSRINEPNTRVNLGGLIYHTDSLPSNLEFSKSLLDTQRKIAEFRKNIKAQYKGTKRKPIVILDYVDCVTNDILIDLMKEIYGESFIDEYAEIVKVDFHSNGFLANRDRIVSILRNWKRKGGILIGGGSWKVDADNEFGQAMKSLWREIDIYDTLSNKDFRSTMIGICSTYQTSLEVIMEGMYGRGQYPSESPRTLGGMFKFLPIGSTITARDPLFGNHIKSGRLTLCHTNSGQLDIPKSLSGKDGFKILAEDDTGIPSIVSLSKKDGIPSFISFQAHPELNPVKDLARLEADMLPLSNHLKDIFGYDSQGILRNYREALENKNVELGLAGRVLLIRALYQLSQV